MSQLSDEEQIITPYQAPQWHEMADPENDAAIALENNDHRLLAFALRSASIPGLEPGQIPVYSELCGLRYMSGFGDVIRSAEGLNRMKLAREYAMRYNSVIISECLPAE